MRLITLYVPESWLRALDRLVNDRKLYPNRAEAIRIGVRDLLNAHNQFPSLESLEPNITAIVNWEKRVKEAT